MFGEIIFNLDQWFRRRCLLKIFLIWSSIGCVQRSGTICAILVEGIMRHTICELISNSGQWIRRWLFKLFLFGALVALLFSRADTFMQFLKKAS